MCIEVKEKSKTRNVASKTSVPLVHNTTVEHLSEAVLGHLTIIQPSS